MNIQKGNTIRISKKIYLLIFRERKWEYKQEGQRGRERESQADSPLSVEPNQGLAPTACEIMTWAKTKSQMLNQLSHSSVPTFSGF